jgi:1,4-alpha-glucan branching enzyme
MLRKTFSKTGTTCKVTFDLSANGNTTKAALCGEFNEWNPDAHPLKRRKDGRFSTTLSLKTGKDYRFKYLIDGQHWENDWGADGYEPNCFGTDDSVVRI